MESHNIKDILENRRVEVSENSWEKLANQLDAHDKKGKRRKWYPYVACIALLIGLITSYISKNIGESQSQTIVGTEKIKTQNEVETEQKPIILKEEIDDAVFKSAIVDAKKSTAKKVKDIEVVSNKETVKKEQSIPNEHKEAVVAIKKEIQETKKIEDLTIITTKNTAVVVAEKEQEIKLDQELKTSIAALSADEKIAITDKEIEQLLKKAQQSLEELNIKKEKVSDLKYATADELLSEVEYELDKSFKQKVFELIKNKVAKTRTAVVDP